MNCDETLTHTVVPKTIIYENTAADRNTKFSWTISTATLGSTAQGKFQV